MNKKGASNVNRCPSCGRVYDGTSCLACGHGSSAEGTPVPESKDEAAQRNLKSKAQNVSPFGGFSTLQSESKQKGVEASRVQNMQSRADNFDEDADTAADTSALGRCPQCGRVITGPNCLACSWLDGEPATGVDEPPAVTAPDDADVAEGSVTYSDHLPPNALSDEEENEVQEHLAANQNQREPPLETQLSQASPKKRRRTPKSSLPMTASAGPPSEPHLSQGKWKKYVTAFAVVFALTVGLGVLVKRPQQSAADKVKTQKRNALVEIESIEKTPADRRTGEQWLELGQARVQLQQNSEALAAFAQAVKREQVNDALLKYLVRMLGDGLMADKASRVLTDYPGVQVDTVLQETLTGGSGFTRRQALKTLRHRGTATISMRVSVNIKDLLTDRVCESRRHALFELKKIARGKDAQRALDALGRLEGKSLDQSTSCLLSHYADARTVLLKQL
jgi:hypothetical protein